MEIQISYIDLPAPWITWIITDRNDPISELFTDPTDPSRDISRVVLSD